MNTAESNAYVPRIVDAELTGALSRLGAVEMKGARATGKTETALHHARSSIRLDQPGGLVDAIHNQPELALQGDTPRLIDEWQEVPSVFNAVRHRVDESRHKGMFILAGSAAPNDDLRRHSGAGRFARLVMRTMTLLETGHSSGAVGIGGLLAGREVAPVENDATFTDVLERMVVGGWPGWWDASPVDARANANDYIDAAVEHDYPLLIDRRPDSRRFRAYLGAMAALVAQPATNAAIERYMQEELRVNYQGKSPVVELSDLASRMYLTEDQPAWSPKLRSATAAATKPTRHLADSSLAAALLGAGVDRLIAEPETAGFLFESQVVHDVRVYAQHVGARGVYHYRDQKNRDEIDVVVEGADGSWVGMEVKLGLRAVDKAAENLQRVAAKMVHPPAKLVVVVPHGPAYTRADGVVVAPLTTLGP